MLQKSYLKDIPGRHLIGIGMACMSVAALLTVSGTRWIEEPAFLVGFIYGLAGVLSGVSIVLNIRGMQRLRREQSGQ